MGFNSGFKGLKICELYYDSAFTFQPSHCRQICKAARIGWCSEVGTNLVSVCEIRNGLVMYIWWILPTGCFMLYKLYGSEASH